MLVDSQPAMLSLQEV